MNRVLAVLAALNTFAALALLAGCASQTPAQQQATIQAGITITEDALPCYAAIKAATSAANAASNIAGGIQAGTTDPACAAITAETVGLIQTAVAAKTAVTVVPAATTP
jgi:hypothetical protein